ncbi:MAG: recombinase family protein, partial [Hyphomicrobiales bacterium]
GSVTELSIEALTNGLIGRNVPSKNNTPRKTKPFGRGNLYHLLSNPIYIGKIKHHDQIYDGQHEAIIKLDVWDAVQQKLKANASNRQSATNSTSPNLFTGLIHDEAGELLSPTHSNKKGKRYFYYISKNPTKKKTKGSDGTNGKPWRLPAHHLDQTILQLLKDNLQTPLKLSKLIDFDGMSVEEQTAIIETTKSLLENLETAEIIKQKKILHSIIDYVLLTQTEIIIHIKIKELYKEKLNIERQTSTELPVIKSIASTHKLKKRGVESKLILSTDTPRIPNPDQSLIMLIAKANLWLQKLSDGSAKTISELATLLDEDRNEISRFLPLAFLSPAITQSILQGTQPVDLTSERIRRLSDIPMDWEEQSQLFGFAS